MTVTHTVWYCTIYLRGDLEGEQKGQHVQQEGQHVELDDPKQNDLDDSEPPVAGEHRQQPHGAAEEVDHQHEGHRLVEPPRRVRVP
jgi:hypothetical protein